MRTTFTRSLAALAISVAALVPLSLVVTSSPASATDNAYCNMGTTLLGTPAFVSFSVNGNALTEDNSYLGVFHDQIGSTGDYSLQLCRWSDQNQYYYSIGRVSGDGHSQWGLGQSDSSRSFHVAFYPTATDVPLTSENRAKVSNFTIDPTSHLVSFDAQSLPYTSVDGCPDGLIVPPPTCAADPAAYSATVADHAENISGAVRYQDTTKSAGMDGAAGFTDLPGLTTSSGAFIMFVWASCPTNANRNQSYSGLRLDLAGPHLKASGDLNTALVSAFIPAAAIAGCFGSDPATFAASPSLTRTEGGSPQPLVNQSAATGATAEGLIYSMTATTHGVTLTVNNATFSKPSYNFTSKAGKALFRTKVTYASIATASHLTKPTHGYQVQIKSGSTNACIAAPSSRVVYGFKKNKTCNLTITGKKSGKTKTVSYSFHIG